jgi:hypothetical protein
MELIDTPQNSSAFLRACTELTRPDGRVDFGTALSRGSLRCFAPSLGNKEERTESLVFLALTFLKKSLERINGNLLK